MLKVHRKIITICDVSAVDWTLASSPLPRSGGVEMRSGCKCIGSLIRYVGRLTWAFQCLFQIRKEHCSRLRHLDWLQYGHGLTSGPRLTGDKMV